MNPTHEEGDVDEEGEDGIIHHFFVVVDINALEEAHTATAFAAPDVEADEGDHGQQTDALDAVRVDRLESARIQIVEIAVHEDDADYVEQNVGNGFEDRPKW